MRLSWFTQVLIDTEAMKVDINSLGGLRPSIHKDVTAMIHPATYDEAVSRAYWFEENQTIQQSETKSKEWTPSHKGTQLPQQGKRQKQGWGF